MEWWQILILSVVAAIVSLAIAAFIVWRLASQRTKRLAARIGDLPWRSKLLLARRLMADDRVPLLVRVIPPLLVLYLALPLDIVPDFIPLLGQVDDIVVLALGIALLVRLTPLRVLDEHLLELETPAAYPRDPSE